MTSRARPTVVSDHAVQRYIQRWRPDIQRELDKIIAEARARLEALSTAAEFIGEIDGEDRAIWAVPTTAEPMLLCEQGGEFSTVLPRGSMAPNRRPRK